MMPPRCRLGVVIVAAFVCAAGGVAMGQPAAEPSALRVNGIIDQNQTWSGLVLLTGDVEIAGATITIEPGTIIEFARATTTRTPVLIVGSARTTGGELKIKATAGAPVIFRAKPDETPGRIVVNIRNRIVPGRMAADPSQGIIPPTIEPNDVTWRHVRFVGLGNARERGGETMRTTVHEAALTFNVTGGPHMFRIANCEFEGCTRVSVRGGDAAKLSIESNRFSAGKDRIALEVQGNLSGDAAEYIFAKANTADAAFSFGGAATTASDNILIGEYVCLVVDQDAASPTRIVGNYIHNTAVKDDGRYCLDCRVPSASIERNVIRGATTCVMNGSHLMRENVFIGTLLRSDAVKNARTHFFVHSLPPGAVFEWNLLLGPAYSMLAPQAGPSKAAAPPQPRPTIVRHNLFDGFDEARRVIHLNPLGGGGGKVAIYNNVFLRATTLVYDEARTLDSLIYLDHNAAAPKSSKAYDSVAVGAIEQGKLGFGGADVVVENPAQLRLRDLPRRVPQDVDDAILGGKMRVESWRTSLFAVYAPLAGSPLVNAGYQIRASQAQQSTQPTIGPREASH